MHLFVRVCVCVYTHTLSLSHTHAMCVCYIYICTYACVCMRVFACVCVTVTLPLSLHNGQVAVAGGTSKLVRVSEETGDAGDDADLDAAGSSMRGLHANTCSNTQRAQQRSLGMEGRSANEDEHTPWNTGRLSGPMIRDGLMSSRSLAVMELEMPSWTVLSLNLAAEGLLGDTPWGSCQGQCLVNSIVHSHDVSILEDLWSEAQSASKPYAQGPPQAANTSRRTIRFSTYRSHDPVSVTVSVKGRHGDKVSSDVEVSTETAASSATNYCFQDPFGTDPLFEDAGAAKKFVEPASGEACVAGGGEAKTASPT